MSANPNTAIVKPAERYAWVAKSLAKRTDALARSLPPGLPVERFQQVACNALRRNPALLQCEIQSIVDTIAFAADMGLEIGGPSGESYIVPFWDHKKKQKIATFIAGYRGLIKLALESPRVLGIEAHVVREGDTFAYQYGTSPALNHVPGPNIKGPVSHAWALARMREGPAQFEVMTVDELHEFFDEARKKSKDNFERSPWATDTTEMMRKTPVRRLAKYLSLNGADRFHRAIESEDRAFRAQPVAIDSSARRDDLLSKLKKQPPGDDGNGAVEDAEWTNEIGDEDGSKEG